MAIEVTDWWRGLWLEQYEPAFRDNEVAAEGLLKRTANDLISIGVASVGPTAANCSTLSRQRITAEVPFFAFDLLYCDGWDLTGTSLENRKAALAQIIPPHADGILRYSDHQEGRGPEFLRQAAGFGLEGIVSKRRDKPYRGGRGNGWLKIKCRNSDEFIVVGFTEPERTRQGFGALLLGYYDPTGALRYAGRVGSGFGEASLSELRTRLNALAIVTPPVSLPQGSSADGVHWTQPCLVAEVQYAGWTAGGLVRQASFQGLRKDKSASSDLHAVASHRLSLPARMRGKRR